MVAWWIWIFGSGLGTGLVLAACIQTGLLTACSRKRGNQKRKVNVVNRKNMAQRLALVGAFSVMAASAHAQTDIPGVITAIDTYRASAVLVGVAILLFTLGRAVVRKIAK